MAEEAAAAAASVAVHLACEERTRLLARVSRCFPLVVVVVVESNM
jgi:hypothetical protein